MDFFASCFFVIRKITYLLFVCHDNALKECVLYMLPCFFRGRWVKTGSPLIAIMAIKFSIFKKVLEILQKKSNYCRILVIKCWKCYKKIVINLFGRCLLNAGVTALYAKCLNQYRCSIGISFFKWLQYWVKQQIGNLWLKQIQKE